MSSRCFWNRVSSSRQSSGFAPPYCLVEVTVCPFRAACNCEIFSSRGGICACSFKIWPRYQVPSLVLVGLGFAVETSDLAFESGMAAPERACRPLMSSFVQTFFAGVCGAGVGEADCPGFCAGDAESFCAHTLDAVNAALAIAKIAAATNLKVRRFIFCLTWFHIGSKATGVTKNYG